MKRLILILTLFLGCIIPSHSAISDWELFSSNGQYRQMASLDGKVYVLSGSSIFWTELNSGQSGSITQADGMHGSDVAFLLNTDQQLVIIYRSGLIDLMSANGTFYDIPDFQNTIIAGDRIINQAKVCGEELFLACAFGVVQFDLTTQEVRYSYNTPDDCLLAFSFGQYLYYNTSKQGLMRCRKDRNYLISSQWEQVLEQPIHDAAVFTDPEGVQRCWLTPQSAPINELDSIGELHRLNFWSNKRLYPSGSYVFCSGWGLQLIRLSDLSQTLLHQSDFNGNVGYFATSDTTALMLHGTYGLRPFSFTFIPSTDAPYSLTQPEFELNYKEWQGTKCADLAIDAAGSLVAINGDKLHTGGYGAMTSSRSIINTLTDNEWSYIFEDSVLQWLRREAADPSTISSNYYRGLTSVVAHPSEPGHIYAGTLTHGLYEFVEGEPVAHIDATNTPGGPAAVANNPKETRLTSLAFDEEGNLWSGYSFADCALAVLSPQGKWMQHPLQGSNSLANAGRIIPTRMGEGWLVWVAQNFGYNKCSVSMLYNPTGAMDSLKDQSVTFRSLIDQDNNLIEPSYIYDLCEDHDGHIWILTANGPFLVEDPVATFNFAQKNNGSGLVRRIKVPRNDGTNLADYLMANTPCTAMAIDNYNRKWVGTNGNGLYLLSPDCTRQLLHLTTQNSLLPSDEVVALAYDGEANRLYISTGNGLAAYHTDDLSGETDYDSMYCFPNPVRPEFMGELRIMGLADHSTVIISDSNGNPILRTSSEGSTLTWDLLGTNGQRVSPGIYLIHGISADSKEGRIIKVLVL